MWLQQVIDVGVIDSLQEVAITAIVVRLLIVAGLLHLIIINTQI